MTLTIKPPQARHVGEAVVRNLGAGVRTARIAADPPEQRTCAVAGANSIDRPLETALSRIDLEERGRGRIAQRLEEHGDAAGRIVRS